MPSEFINNENRARLKDSLNRPSPANADSGFVRPDESRLRGLCSATPMCLDPHAAGRGHTDNAIVKQPERPRSYYTAETRRRETSVVDKYK